MQRLSMAAVFLGGDSDFDSIEVFPRNLKLEGQRDRQSIVVQATRTDGVTADLTADSEISVADPTCARVEGNVLFPLRDAETTVIVHAGARSFAVPLSIRGTGAPSVTSFRLDVTPVLMKGGCNQGSCHGSARGQDGFHLSLFGYDPAGDYHAMTRELAARRINLAIPEESLLLEKPLGKVPHTGGTRFPEDSDHYRTLLSWLESGCPDDPATVAQPTSIELAPPSAVLEDDGSTQQLAVRAHYSDGTDRDVTSLAVFLSSNDASASVSPQGSIKSGMRGEAFVMARFSTVTVGVPVIVVPKDMPFQWIAPPGSSYIDELIDQKLKKLRVNPSGRCSDETFLRRAFLDIVGVLPSRAEFESYLSDASEDKRARLVDDLLSRKEFAELWVMKFAELLQIRTDDANKVSYKATLQYYLWLQERIARNVPFDQIVRELLSASGGTFTNPATNYFQIERDPLKIAENCAQVFMGIRVQCAQCHNHPFDRWTMNDYYGFAAFFAQIGRKEAEDPRETIVFNSGGGETAHPVTKQAVPPKFMGGERVDLKGRDRREWVAEWLTSPDNAFFSRNLANIVWAHFFGQGIVEPVDDVRVSNPPCNEPLLSELARRFTEYRYDFKQLVRDICTSRTYQLATATNETNALDPRNFSHGPIRRIRAEVLLDSISQVTDTPNKFRGLPLGARAVQIADGNVGNYFLSTFGRATRETVCSCEVKMEPNLSQALHLLNGENSHARVRDGGLVKRLVEAGKSPAEVLEELFIRCFARRPTEEEKTELLAQAADPAEMQSTLEDTFWALLNSKEFVFNH